MPIPNRRRLGQLVSRALDTALEVQEPAVRAYIDRARRSDPALTDADLIQRLERQYLAAVTSMGVASGAAAAAPSFAPLALPVNLAEVGTFIETTTLYVLALAVVYDIPIADLERRRTLVLAILLGDAGAGIIAKIAGRVGPHLARHIVTSIPLSTIRAMNRVLGHNFVTRYGTKQGILVLGREIPFFIGAAIGGAGNVALAYASVRAARRIFGPPPGQDSDPATPAGDIVTVAATGRAGARIVSYPTGLDVLVGTAESAHFTGVVTLHATAGHDAIWSGAGSSNGDRSNTCTFTPSGPTLVTANVL
jgi:hypothetical protein